MGQLADHRIHQQGEVHRGEVDRRAAQAGERQQAVDELAHVPRRATDGAEVAPRGFVDLVVEVLFQQADEAGDVAQR
ncbi:hypothetical protein D9M68_798880 [compost metagenome]